jgi:probable rRNA maturation factor
MLNINVINQSKVRVSKKFITQWFANMATLLPLTLQKRISNKDLNIVFLDRGEAKKMNFSFRGKNYATDILSFEPISEGELGELILCPQVINRQAKEHGLTEREELGYMLIHGCLHLLGYDHEVDEGEAKRMYRLQDKIFAQMTALTFQ